MLPKEAVMEFMDIYLKSFGLKLSYVDAEEKANKVFNFMKLIIRPVAESNKLAEGNHGQKPEAERNIKTYGNKKESKKSGKY